jgi:amino acid transporter
VFSYFYNNTNISNPFYLFSVGFLVSIFTINGFDSAGQICSEIPDAEDNCPKAIINSLVLSIAAAFLVLMSILFHLGGKDDAYIQSLISS